MWRDRRIRSWRNSIHICACNSIYMCACIFVHDLRISKVRFQKHSEIPEYVDLSSELLCAKYVYDSMCMCAYTFVQDMWILKRTCQKYSEIPDWYLTITIITLCKICGCAKNFDRLSEFFYYCGLQGVFLCMWNIWISEICYVNFWNPHILHTQ